VCSRECPRDVVVVLNFDPFHPASTDVAESRGFSQSDQRMPISLKPLRAALFLIVDGEVTALDHSTVQVPDTNDMLTHSCGQVEYVPR